MGVAVSVANWRIRVFSYGYRIVEEFPQLLYAPNHTNTGVSIISRARIKGCVKREATYFSAEN